MKCRAFEHGLHVNLSSELRPCCRWKGPGVTISEDYRSRFRAWADHLDAEWLPQCADCREDERDGYHSLRQIFNSVFEQGEGIKLDLKISNLCNLACRMCDAGNSSKIANMLDSHRHLAWQQPLPEAIRREITVQTLDHICELTPRARIIKFTGGEPTIIPQVMRVIQTSLDSGSAANTELHLTTNLARPLSEWWLQVFRRFKSVHLSCSVDGIKDRYEYIRGFSRWSDLVANLNQIRELKKQHPIGLSVVSMWFVLTADIRRKVEQYWRHRNIPFGWSPCYEPEYLGWGALNPDLRSLFGIKNSRPYREELWQQLVTEMACHDEVHGTDFRKACPLLF